MCFRVGDASISERSLESRASSIYTYMNIWWCSMVVHVVVIGSTRCLRPSYLFYCHHMCVCVCVIWLKVQISYLYCAVVYINSICGARLCDISKDVPRQRRKLFICCRTMYKDAMRVRDVFGTTITKLHAAGTLFSDHMICVIVYIPRSKFYATQLSSIILTCALCRWGLYRFDCIGWAFG